MFYAVLRWTEPQLWCQNHILRSNQSKQKNWAISMLSKAYLLAQFCIKPSQFLWRLYILRLTNSIIKLMHCKLESDWNQKTKWVSSKNKKIGPSQCSSRSSLPNALLWNLLDFSGELTICVSRLWTSSCTFWSVISKSIELKISVRRSLLSTIR